MHFQDPEYQFRDNSLEMSIKIKKEYWQSGAYCDAADYIRLTDPRHLFEINNQTDPNAIHWKNMNIGKVNRQVNLFGSAGWVLHDGFEGPFMRLKKYGYPDHYWMGRHFYPEFMHNLANYVDMHDYCHKLINETTPARLHDCALSAANMKSDMDTVTDYYFDF